jgi:hypothetical protein
MNETPIELILVARDLALHQAFRSRFDYLPNVTFANCEFERLSSNEITPLIEAVGASVINLSPYSPDFNLIEHWWSQLKAFLRTFSPLTLTYLHEANFLALEIALLRS